MNQNVKLPMELLTTITRVLLQIDIYSYDEAFRAEYDAALLGLRKKLSAIELRDSYSKIIFAKDDSSRAKANAQYLQKKRSFQEDC